LRCKNFTHPLHHIAIDKVTTMNKTSATPIGIAVGIALGFAGAFGGFWAFLLVLVTAIVGGVIGAVIDGRINVGDYVGGRSNRSTSR
jgi:hypothetical protein